ncbi:MAG: mechanosensitive ion channel family protein [Bacteroidota bacterium]
MKEAFNTFTSELGEAFDSFIHIFTTPLFEMGDSKISIGTIFYFVFAFIILGYISKKIRRFLLHTILPKTHLDKGVSASVASIVRIIIIIIGSIIIVDTAGIDLSALTLLAGALGVGIGFGLQNITDNFISGIIILFEKPIKVGDRIEVGDVQGDVISISFRATTIQTNDNISIIVPNSEFISSRVINWSHNDRNIRFRIPVGVSYKENPEKITKILLEVANKNPHVNKTPEPSVLFDEFGDSSINFILAVWTTSHTDRPRVLRSELYFEIFKRFGEEGVEIPFPQRDLHLKTPFPTSN